MARGDGQNLLSVLAQAGSAALGAVPNAKAKKNDDALKMLAATIQAHQAEQEVLNASLRQTLLRKQIAEANNKVLLSNRELNTKPEDEIKDLYGALTGLNASPGSHLSYGGLSITTPKPSTDEQWTMGSAQNIADIAAKTGLLPAGIKSAESGGGANKAKLVNYVEKITDRYEKAKKQYNTEKRAWEGSLLPNEKLTARYQVPPPQIEDQFKVYKDYIDQNLGPGAADSVAALLGIQTQQPQGDLTNWRSLFGSKTITGPEQGGLVQLGAGTSSALTAEELAELEYLAKKAGM